MKHFFIVEQTTIVNPDEIKILNESKLENGRTNVRAVARVQSKPGKPNANNRIYETSVMESIVGQLSPRAKSNSLLQEIDHPMFFPGSDNPEKMKQRAAVVMLDNCCSKLTNIYFKNGEILGEFNTLSGLT